uniref:dolichol kinase n=1 Tax=Aegilops tauschii TaxID=37682 RepID=M8C7K8_AEGTA
MASSSALLTGERLVVFLFAARVALAAPARLAAPLALLAGAALAVELAVDRSAAAPSSPLRRFRTSHISSRPGASSGILLGATTLPCVMLARLIQLSRILPTDPNGAQEFAYLEMQYWAVSISCASVLAFFLWHLRQSANNEISKALKYGSLMVVLYLVTFLLFFLLKTDGGLLAMTKNGYLLCHGVAAVILIKHILEKFPSCSSFGEGLLVSSGLVVYFGDILARTLSKMEVSASSGAFIHTPGTQSEIATVIQCRHGRGLFKVLKSIRLFGFLTTCSPIQMNGFFYAHTGYLSYVYQLEGSTAYQSKPAFLDLAFGAAFALFLILEMIRVWEVYPLGHTIHQFMNAFTDHRDSEILIISHFSLLLGCALPKWMSSGFNDRPLAPFAGILSLGIGDTMASMIGYKYGVLRWSKTGKKTIEGTAAGITSVLAACSILVTLLASSGYILSQPSMSVNEEQPVVHPTDLEVLFLVTANIYSTARQ